MHSARLMTQILMKFPVQRDPEAASEAAGDAASEAAGDAAGEAAGDAAGAISPVAFSLFLSGRRVFPANLLKPAVSFF